MKYWYGSSSTWYIICLFRLLFMLPARHIQLGLNASLSSSSLMSTRFHIRPGVIRAEHLAATSAQAQETACRTSTHAPKCSYNTHHYSSRFFRHWNCAWTCDILQTCTWYIFIVLQTHRLPHTPLLMHAHYVACLPAFSQLSFSLSISSR